MIPYDKCNISVKERPSKTINDRNNLRGNNFMYTIQQNITKINPEQRSPSSPQEDSKLMSQPETITRKTGKRKIKKIPIQNISCIFIKILGNT
jgi:hypothetical protein